MFIELNNGTKQNIMSIYSIKQEGTDIIYKMANNSLHDIVEHFETETEASNKIADIERNYGA